MIEVIIMSVYFKDREFTNYVHELLAVPVIYRALNWMVEDIPEEILEQLDIKKGIDYIAKDIELNIVKIQERFREQKYQNYNDFTMRYKRDHNINIDRVHSEFFKIDADFMVYGITNGVKDELNSNTNFIKYVVVDLKELFKLIDDERIQFKSSLWKCESQNGKLIAPINDNHDKSSSFVTFDIQMLHDLFPDKNLIVIQKGFLIGNTLF